MIGSCSFFCFVSWGRKCVYAYPVMHPKWTGLCRTRPDLNKGRGILIKKSLMEALPPGIQPRPDMRLTFDYQSRSPPLRVFAPILCPFLGIFLLMKDEMERLKPLPSLSFPYLSHLISRSLVFSEEAFYDDFSGFLFSFPSLYLRRSGETTFFPSRCTVAQHPNKRDTQNQSNIERQCDPSSCNNRGQICQ